MIHAHDPSTIGEYHFDEGAGLDAFDDSGNGNHGILRNGPTWVAGRANGALNFDGVNDHVELNNLLSLNPAGAITIAAWVNPVAVNASQFVVAKDNLPSGRLQYFLRLQGSAVRMGIRTTADNFLTSPANLITPNTWYHVAGAWDGQLMRLYVNGALVATSTTPVTGTMTDNGVAVRIGGRQDGALPFRGKVDEVSIFNRALSAAEIQVMYSFIALDVTPPTVSIDTPADGATLTGTIAVDASAFDNVAVAGVQFRVDGNNLGAEDSAFPYSAMFDSTSVPDGPHQFTAVGRDTSGNLTTSLAIHIEVDNTVPDTVPPILSNGQPSGTLTPGTTEAALSATTNEGADCRYGTTPGESYGQKTEVFSSTGSTSHSTLITNLQNGTTYDYYIRCRDAAGNENASDFPINFFIASPVAGQLALLHLDENLGLTASDFSGRSNHGTLVNGVSWTTGKFGSGLSFDGTNDYVTLGNQASLNPTSAITIAAWVNPVAVNASQFVVAKDNLPSGRLQYFLRLQGAAVRMGIRTTADHFLTSPGNLITPNTWYHVAGTWDGQLMRLYLNGALVATSTTPVAGTMTDNGVATRIGGRQDGALPFRGKIDEVEIYDRALSASEVQAILLGQTLDTTPPIVGITSPASGTQVSGTFNVTVSATDNVSLSGVQFQIDGVNFSSEVTVAPYSVALDTTTLSDADHSLAAIARDVAGNSSTSSPVTIHVLNDPAQIGRVSAPIPFPVVAVHAILLHTGDVLMFKGNFNTNNTTAAELWNLQSNTFTPVPLGTTNVFCAGHAALPDGRLLVMGGHDGANGILGIADANLFDPVAKTWTALPQMAYRRWYPTATVLPDGRILVTGGGDTCFSCFVGIPEIYDPSTNSWTQLTAANNPVPFYPYMFLLPDGRVIDVGADEHPVVAQALDLNTQSWSVVDPNLLNGGSAAMYAPGRILKSGSSTDGPNNNSIAVATAYVLDMTQPTPAWRQVASMNSPRVFHTLTLLPDGNTAVTGGGRKSSNTDPTQAVHEVEIWSPQTEQWSVMARNQVPRFYHSSALLLPDATVLISGSGDSSGPNQNNGEIFSPPYLFRGPRPTIASAPAAAQYGSSFQVDTPDAANIGSVVLMKLGAMTHTFDQEQRRVVLTFQQAGSGLQVDAPTDPKLAPPGYYMLFLINSNGVPSVSTFIRIEP